MSPLQSIPPWAIAIVVCLMIATFTECTSNVATATLFLPVLASMVCILLIFTMTCISTQLNSILFIEHFQTIRMDQSAVHS